MDKLKEWTERPVDRTLEALGYVFMGGTFAVGIIQFGGMMAPGFVGAGCGVGIIATFLIRYARGSFGIPSESHPAAPNKKK